MSLFVQLDLVGDPQARSASAEDRFGAREVQVARARASDSRTSRMASSGAPDQQGEPAALRA